MRKLRLLKVEMKVGSYFEKVKSKVNLEHHNVTYDESPRHVVVECV